MSSLEYINSQLVAHGFAPSPGLVLDGISNTDQDRVVKCLFGMLNQRIEDLSRTEELTTNLRTLTYEHERLRSMHRSTTERAANAEREMNVHKTRSTAVARALQSSETAHKHTTAELQRTRTLLQGVRATCQSELKKKEKDIERMTEKWSKLADVQAKLAAIPSEMRCANVGIVDGSEVIGKGQGFLEIALEEAENTRCQLGKENIWLRKLVLTAVNEIQSVLYQARRIVSDNGEEQPTPFTLTTLFPLHPQTNTNDKLDLVLSGLRECLTALSTPNTVVPSISKPAVPVSDGEVLRLQGIINSLKEEIKQTQKQSQEHAAETQSMFDKFMKDHRIASGDVGEMSVELMTAPLRDEEKGRLDEIKNDLDLERQNFTEAALKLGKERAELEAQKIKFLDEKRSWQVEMMLAELPPTPQPVASPKQGVAARSSPKKSPRKSPGKICVGKAGVSGRKATRVSRRSLASPSKVVPSYETEVLPPIPAPTFNIKPLPLAASLLPNSFVLPPPSPHTSLPSQPALPPSNSQEEDQPPSNGRTCITPLPAPAAVTSGSTLTPSAAHWKFPVAKPLAQRMIHAYSPAKPSPLSRILMLGNSPNSPDEFTVSDPDVPNLFQPVAEEDEGIIGFEKIPKVAVSMFPLQPQISLTAELSVESPPGSPLQEKKLEHNVDARPVAGAGAGKATVKGRMLHPDPKRISAKGKGKAKTTEPVVNMNTQSRVRTVAAVEKENSVMKLNGKVFSAPGISAKISPPGSEAGEINRTAVRKPPVKPVMGTSTSHAKLSTKMLPQSKGGPRRVPVDSIEAPAIGKGWRG